MIRNIIIIFFSILCFHLILILKEYFFYFSCEDTCIQWQHLTRELITLSFNIAYVVEPIVCNSSPEGHLPMDTDSGIVLFYKTLFCKIK